MNLTERMMHYTTADFLNFTSPVRNYALQIAPDAPFRLYGIAFFPLDGIAGGNANTLRMRFTKPDGTWMQRGLVPTAALATWQPPTNAVNGQFSPPNSYLFSPIYPNVVYPPNSVITIDIERIDGTNAALNTLVVFIGTNVYQDGRGAWNPTQLPRSASTPFFGYNVFCDAAQLALGRPVLNVPLNINPDADFVWQAGVHTDIPPGPSFTFEPPEAAGIKFVATRLGTPSDLIEVSYTGYNGGPANLPFTITVTGTLIAIQSATDGAGVSITTFSQIAAAMNANPAVQKLGVVTSVLIDGVWADLFDGFLTGGGEGPDGILLNLGVRMKDWNGKYYSNQQTNQNNPLAGFVPAAVLFGYNNGQTPGLIYPEIYLPRNAALYFDFAMLDGTTNPGGQTPIINLKGQKVYAT